MRVESANMKRMLSGHETVVAAKKQVSCNLADDAVILDLQAGVYYGLNAVAARVWNLIQEPKTVAQIRDAIVDEYDVDPDRCECDLRLLLGDLMARGLVRAADEEAA
jgi:hypothetical protein